MDMRHKVVFIFQMKFYNLNSINIRIQLIRIIFILPSQTHYFTVQNFSQPVYLISPFDIIDIDNINLMQRERELKQKYLRQHILESNYDAQEFMDFCQNLKGSVDIDTWSLNQLKDIVQKFIKSNAKTIEISPFEYKGVEPNSGGGNLDNFDWDNAFSNPISTEQKSLDLNSIDLDFLQSMGMDNKLKKTSEPMKRQQPLKKMTTTPSEILAKLNDKNNLFISAYNSNALKVSQQQKNKDKDQSPTLQKQTKAAESANAVLIPIIKEIQNQQSFKAIIKCKSFSNKPKLDGDYQIIVSGHEIINPNVFVPNFVLYTITTNPINKQVKRRMKDFQMLRSLLKKIFPSTQIPHLERYGRLSETQPSVIKRQKLFIESFLNSLMMNKNIRCKIIDQFLLADNLDSVKKLFRDFEKVQKPKAIEDLYTPEGKTEVQYNTQNKKYLNQQQLLFDYLEPSFEKLKGLYDQLLLSFANTVKIIQDISDMYDNMRDSIRNVNNLFSEQYKSTSLEYTLEKISQMHKHWALSLKTQSKVMEVEIRHLYRFQFDNLQTIKEVCKVSDSIIQSYQKRVDKEAASKDSYENKRLSEFKVGVEVPSKNITVLKHQSAYYLQQSTNEIRRYLKELSDKMLKKFKIFSVLQLNICNDLEANWKDFQSFAS